MLKFTGIFLIVTGAAGCGRYFISCLKLHLEQLVECREIFTQVDAGRAYLKLPYAQLLKRTAKGKHEIFSEILLEVADEMEKNREADASALWAAAFQKRKQQLFLKEEEKNLLLSLARSLMLEGDHTQVARIYFLQLENRILKVMEEKRKNRNYTVQSAFSEVCFW